MNFISRWESFQSHAYYDATGKKWTIGYGHTRTGAARGSICTKKQALIWLRQDCKPIAKYLNSSDCSITQYQFDALVSFAFNCGLGNLKRSTLLALVKHSAPVKAVSEQFYRWYRSGGKPLAGLVLRREAESMMYESGKYATREDAMVHIENRLGKDWRKLYNL